MKRILLSAAALLLALGTSAFAGTVKVEGVHLCCGGCVKAATAALTGIDGVSGVKVDKDNETVSYDAKDAKAAEAGIAALAKAGYAGKAKEGDKELAFPNVKTDAKGDSVKITGVHNCCGQCVKAIQASLKAVDGVTEVKCDKTTCTVTGKSVSHKALVDALHEAGLHGSIGS